MSATSLSAATNKEVARRFLLAIPAKDAMAMRLVLAPEAHLAPMPEPYRRVGSVFNGMRRYDTPFSSGGGN